MEKQIKVKKVLLNELKDVYRNIVKIPVGISFSFVIMLDALRWLYSGCLYQLNIII